MQRLDEPNVNTFPFRVTFPSWNRFGHSNRMGPTALGSAATHGYNVCGDVELP